MRVLITGVAGFIGHRLAAGLLDTGAEVVGIDAFSDYYDPAIKRRNVAGLSERGGSRFTLVDADLTMPGWEHHLDGVEVVLHQAGQPGVRASWTQGFDAYAHHNILATQRLLEALRVRHLDGGVLRRVVYASSSSIYGDALTLPTPESATPAPRSPYGVTKLAGEHLCGTYAAGFGLPVVALRYFTVYGGGQRPDMAIHRLIDCAAEGTPFTRFGDGSQERDLTHVADVVAANLAAAMTDGLPPGAVYNVAGGTRVTLSELIDAVGRAVGRPVPVVVGPEQPGDVRRTGGDTRGARAALGWRPQVGLPEGLAEQVAVQLGELSVAAQEG